MDNELLFCEIKSPAGSLLLSFLLFVHFPVFSGQFVSFFSQKLYKLQFFKMAYIQRMSDCTVELRLKLIFFMFIHFTFFPYFAC